MGFKLIALAASTLVLSTSVNAATLTFDETTPLGPWLGGGLADRFSIPELTDTAGSATWVCGLKCGSAYSGDNAMYNFDTREARLLRSTAFDLVGAYFMNDPQSSPGISTFEVFGYDATGNQLYYSVETVTDNWTFITLNMYGISDFRFNPLSPDVQNMMMDDMLYNASVVPVPAATWLFASGLLGLVGVARHKRSV